MIQAWSGEYFIALPYIKPNKRHIVMDGRNPVNLTGFPLRLKQAKNNNHFITLKSSFSCYKLILCIFQNIHPQILINCYVYLQVNNNIQQSKYSKKMNTAEIAKLWRLLWKIIYAFKTEFHCWLRVPRGKKKYSKSQVMMIHITRLI